MYRMEESSIFGEDHLFAFLKQWGLATSGRVGIVAGHLMLMYDNASNRLVPMIWQDADNDQVAVVAKELAGDFPVYTFELGLRLLDVLPKDRDPKLLLVINDHLFQSSSWNGAFSRSSQDAGLLRREYYRSTPRLTASYEKLLSGYGKHFEDVFLDNNSSVRNKQSVLPKQTHFFSEQVFRNQFGRDTEALLNSRYFYNQSEGNQSAVMFSPWGSVENGVCLTEDGKCGCSGEVIQMLMHLMDRGITSVVSFVPEECVVAFNQGVKAALHFMAKSMRVVVIAGSNNDFAKAMAGDRSVAVLFETFSHRWENDDGSEG